MRQRLERAGRAFPRCIISPPRGRSTKDGEYLELLSSNGGHPHSSRTGPFDSRPRLRLGAHCLRGPPRFQFQERGGASPAARSQAEPGNEVVLTSDLELPTLDLI